MPRAVSTTGAPIDYSVEGVEDDRSRPRRARRSRLERHRERAQVCAGCADSLARSRNNGHAVISVRDEGPGMSESERLHASSDSIAATSAERSPVRGLGLAIAKRASNAPAARSRSTARRDRAPPSSSRFNVQRASSERFSAPPYNRADGATRFLALLLMLLAVLPQAAFSQSDYGRDRRSPSSTPSTKASARAGARVCSTGRSSPRNSPERTGRSPSPTCPTASIARAS